MVVEAREALIFLADWRRTREERQLVEATEKVLAGLLKDYLESSEEPDLVDQETGFGVRLQERAAVPSYDLLSMPEPLFQRLWSLGCLVADPKLVKAQCAAGQLLNGDVAHYEMPGKVSHALVAINGKPGRE